LFERVCFVRIIPVCYVLITTIIRTNFVFVILVLQQGLIILVQCPLVANLLRFESLKQRQELAQRLKNSGCDVNLSGTDWHTIRNFDVKN